MKRPKQVCPECGAVIYLNHGFAYQCPVHGEYDLNYRTGTLYRILPPKKEVKNYQKREEAREEKSL